MCGDSGLCGCVGTVECVGVWGLESLEYPEGQLGIICGSFFVQLCNHSAINSDHHQDTQIKLTTVAYNIDKASTTMTWRPSFGRHGFGRAVGMCGQGTAHKQLHTPDNQEDITPSISLWATHCHAICGQFNIKK